MVDRYTYHLLEFMESVSPNSAKKLSEIKKVCPTQQCISTPGILSYHFYFMK